MFFHNLTLLFVLKVKIKIFKYSAKMPIFGNFFAIIEISKLANHVFHIFFLKLFLIIKNFKNLSHKETHTKLNDNKNHKVLFLSQVTFLFHYQFL